MLSLSRSLACATAAVVALGPTTARGQAPPAAREPGVYTLGPDSLPQPGVPKGRLEGPIAFKSRILAGTVRRYWVYVPAQYQADRPANLLVFQDGQRATNPEGTLRVPQVLENLVHKREIPVTIGVFVTPGHLADTYPDDIAARRRILRTTIVTADAFSQFDSHTVRFFDPATKALERRPIQVGDRGSLWEYLDWMISPSSNSAAGMVMREAMLLRQFGSAYPLAEPDIRRFFAQTPKPDLTALFERTFCEPVTRNGLGLDFLRQGSFLTATGKRMVPGAGDSYGSARELMRYLLRMEQGRLVDEFSSREIKRLMYVTENRIRYAASPALTGAAVYFKSGSLFQCRAEPEFRCGQYMGNVKNYMNSVAIVESPASERRWHYMVTLISNVLRKNSAVDHQGLATRVQHLILQGRVPRGAP